MAPESDTESLVREFVENPGAEAEDLEFKSKEILQSTAQKKKLVRILSAMANRQGGTIIIGVRWEGDDVKLQGFDPGDEPRQELTHIAQQYTKPPLPGRWRIRFDDCLGKRLLRIDVQQSAKEVCQFHYDGEYRTYIREEDGMREMSTGEIADFYERATLQRSTTRHSPIERTVQLEYTPPSVETELDTEAFDRAVTRISNDHTVVLGSGVLGDRLGKSLTYSLTTKVPSSRDYSFSIPLLESAAEHLDADLDWSLGYAIRGGNAQVMGCTVSALREDLERLAEIASYLEGVSTDGWNYGPALVGYTRCSYGILWFEAQQETETFTRWTLELILPDLPVDDADIRSFFADVGSQPTFYSHDAGTQYVHFNGRGCGPLQNPRPIDILGDTDYGALHAVVDNPFFGWPEELTREMETPLPKWCSRGIESVTRMPFQVSGGYVEDEADTFFVNYVTMRYVSGTHPTILLDCSCWQREFADQ